MVAIMGKHVVRNYADGDFDAYYQLYKSVLSPQPWEDVEAEEEVKRSVFNSLFYSPSRHFLAFEDKRLVGSLWSLINPAYIERHGLYPYIEIMVHPQSRREKVGKRLLDSLKQRVSEGAIKGLDAFVEGRNHGAAEFLVSEGFERTKKGFLKMERTLKEMGRSILPKGFTVRNPILPNELEAIVENMNACCSTMKDHLPYTKEYIGTRPYIVDRTNHNGSFLLERNGELVGTIFSTFETKPANGGLRKGGGIYALGVLPEYRGMGLGKALLQKSTEWIMSQGGETAYLYLDAKNAPALGLYQKAGYVITKEEYKYRLELR